MAEEDAKRIQRNYYSGTVRPTNQETVAIGKIVRYSQLPRGGVTAHHTKPHREAPGMDRR